YRRQCRRPRGRTRRSRTCPRGAHEGGAASPNRTRFRPPPPFGEWPGATTPRRGQPRRYATPFQSSSAGEDTRQECCREIVFRELDPGRQRIAAPQPVRKAERERDDERRFPSEASRTEAVSQASRFGEH